MGGIEQIAEMQVAIRFDTVCPRRTQEIDVREPAGLRIEGLKRGIERIEIGEEAGQVQVAAPMGKLETNFILIGLARNRRAKRIRRVAPELRRHGELRGTPIYP